MKQKEAKIVVYGSKLPCPSCLHSPSSLETYEWLKAALARKYPNQLLKIEYVDIQNPPNQTDPFVESIIEGEVFYPAVVLNGNLIGEGNLQLKTIYGELEKIGYVPS